MKVNAENVEGLAEAAWTANGEFRTYLKMQDRWSGEKLDQKVFDIADRVSAEFDCSTCSNCCKELPTNITAAEALRLAKRLSLSLEAFREAYLEPAEKGPFDDDEPSWKIVGPPCPFLVDNRCAVYEDRPRECRQYPYLHEPGFSFRTLGMLERTFTCPIVYQVIEELKAEMAFRPRRR